MKTFKLHLIRHGITAGNLQGLYIGSGTDIPLCDEGRAQLADLKERFEYPQVDTVFSSPMLRAVETANILFPNAAHTFTVHDLREAALYSVNLQFWQDSAFGTNRAGPACATLLVYFQPDCR